MVPEAKAHPLILHRCAFQLLDLARQEGHSVVHAIQDIYADTSERWLKRLGFEFVGMEARGPRWERTL